MEGVDDADWGRLERFNSFLSLSDGETTKGPSNDDELTKGPENYVDTEKLIK